MTLYEDVHPWYVMNLASWVVAMCFIVLDLATSYDFGWIIWGLIVFQYTTIICQILVEPKRTFYAY